MKFDLLVIGDAPKTSKPSERVSVRSVSSRNGIACQEHGLRIGKPIELRELMEDRRRRLSNFARFELTQVSVRYSRTVFNRPKRQLLSFASTPKELTKRNVFLHRC